MSECACRFGDYFHLEHFILHLRGVALSLLVLEVIHHVVNVVGASREDLDNRL